ncbi:MAG: acyl-ACP--UDP-N-acetylglucosamine O-acyltransferase, partial [Candidatus Eremiobacteraeota bacterium]|nr:acyl-ACP--UDP-N-acetylglucosamine O-acyltransferase [Candidatus Eremiobacteraeota bacterium]
MIHQTAIVHPKAVVGRGAEIGPYCVIGEHVSIGDRTRLLAHVVVNGRTTIGQDCVVYPFASIGMQSQDRKYEGEFSYTTIGDRTTLREFVSIHRATGEGETTQVGNDCLLLTYVHVAHNCRVGNFVTMSSTAQLAGHVIVDDYATLGGMAGVHQFVRIGTYAMVGGFSKTARDVPPYTLVEGLPSSAHGLNSIGLRRAQFPRETIADLKAMYKALYLSQLNTKHALEAMREIVKTEEGRRLIAFVENSERGIVKRARADDPSADPSDPETLEALE